MSVPEQIMILLALTSGLFDTIPLDKIREAEVSLLESSKDLPEEILDRLFSGKKLSDDDRQSILEIAGEKLSSFQEKPEPKKIRS
jgi:F-type H+-transporting ATPase subunit alpha